MLIRQQADYCAAMGVLIANHEVFDPLNSVLRGAVEYASRAMWLLDPDTEDPARQDVELGHRRRCARQLLTELVSVYHLRDSLRGLPGTDERAAEAKLRWKALKQAAKARFAEVVDADDPSKWSIAGEPYASWTTVAEAWARANGGYVSGDTLYKLLAVDGHPQGFSATMGLVRGETGMERRVLIDELSNRVQLAVVAFYSSLMMLASYHGYESTTLSEWEARVESVFSGALR